MNLWVLLIASVVCAWCTLRIFTAERFVKVTLMEFEHMRQQAERRRADMRMGRRRSH